jgi:hypothetical protein
LLATLLFSTGACRRSEGTYQGYADRVAAVGDSALLSVASYFTLDSTGAVRWDTSAAAQLERQATELGGVMRPDTVELFHRQMLEGLDSLVVAMRVLREREVACGGARTIDCVDARDFGRILGSMRAGARIYLDGRRRMRETLSPLGASLPDPPTISSRVLGRGRESRAAP